ncbi:hypothetical protein ACFW04_014385 [Cataglyphis niger]
MSWAQYKSNIPWRRPTNWRQLGPSKSNGPGQQWSCRTSALSSAFDAWRRAMSSSTVAALPTVRGCRQEIAAEPYQIPETSLCWNGDRACSVAINGEETPHSFPAELVCEPVLGCYISPNVGLAHFEFLDDVSAGFRRQLPCPIIVAGDFNAKSAGWGSRRTDVRGRALEDWAATLGLCLLTPLNTGSRAPWCGSSGSPT